MSDKDPAVLHFNKKLAKVDLSHNKLTSLGQFRFLESLVHLSAEGNELRSIPPELGLLPRLSTLSVGGNPQRSIPLGTVDGGWATLKPFLLKRLGEAYRLPGWVKANRVLDPDSDDDDDDDDDDDGGGDAGDGGGGGGGGGCDDESVEFGVHGDAADSRAGGGGGGGGAVGNASLGRRLLAAHVAEDRAAVGGGSGGGGRSGGVEDGGGAHPGVAALVAEVAALDEQLASPAIGTMAKVTIKKQRQLKNAERIRLERKIKAGA